MFSNSPIILEKVSLFPSRENALHEGYLHTRLSKREPARIDTRVHARVSFASTTVCSITTFIRVNEEAFLVILTNGPRRIGLNWCQVKPSPRENRRLQAWNVISLETDRSRLLRAESFNACIADKPTDIEYHHLTIKKYRKHLSLIHQEHGKI